MDARWRWAGHGVVALVVLVAFSGCAGTSAKEAGRDGAKAKQDCPIDQHRA